ncbi:MAG TPA: PepSY domain-containing protein [Candidatus Acetatifactor stercoripullorum]|uniref:PepSY domain-containing protein n=1 Tax=Candidatus Acetatifactor stercoripullorum TaxID=2838414 RepID=A0A9D1R597_9FIRM|nr:PepSY domain-containing protein [Candidatus Acetatifactor stercoripullorum]
MDFYTSTQEYDYEINADTGEIYSRSVESFQTGAQVNTGSGTNANHSYIGVDAAKSAALSHAGVSADSATFSKAKLDNDDGRMEYEIEFYAGGMEYDYTIDAFDGTILEYDSERWD